MSRKKQPKRTALEEQLFRELLVNQTTKVGKRKSENKGWSDTPLFGQKQSELF